MAKITENNFKEACIGYGFQEVEQTPDGLYCTGCLTTHKRPTKMYSNYPPNHPAPNKEVLCKFQVVRLYTP